VQKSRFDVAGQHDVKRHLPPQSGTERGRQSVLLIEKFMFINRKLFPYSQVKEDALPFSLVWDVSQRHQGTKRIHGEIKLSLGVLRRYFLQKKLSRTLMIFQDLLPNTCLAVSEDAPRRMASAACDKGWRISASRHVLPTQHNTGQGFISARVVPAVGGGILCKAQRQDWTNSHQQDGSKAVQGSL